MQPLGEDIAVVIVVVGSDLGVAECEDQDGCVRQ